MAMQRPGAWGSWTRMRSCSGCWCRTPLRTAWAAPLLMPDAVHPPSSIVDASFVVAAHRAGLRLHVWAVADATDAQRLLSLGVDGLIVDNVRETQAMRVAFMALD